MNFVVIFICIYIIIHRKVCASVSELDDTDLNSIPPLYDLDEWKECQQRDDVYCIVDAALLGSDSFILNKLQLYGKVAALCVMVGIVQYRSNGYYREIDNPSAVKIKDFSNQSLKHYNRTQIHRGVCVTRCDTTDESENFWNSSQFCVNRSLNKYALEGKVESVAWCSRVGEHVAASPQARALAVLCTALIAFACLATALHVLGDSCVNTDGNKYLLAFSLKRNWRLLTCDRLKPRSHERMGDVACIEGIRFLGTQCVIFSHVVFVYAYSFIDNPEFIENMYDQFVWKVVLSTPLWLQAFFSMSGFLTAYAVLLNTERSTISIYKCFMSIINRWIRYCLWSLSGHFCIPPESGLCTWASLASLSLRHSLQTIAHRIRLTPMALFALWFTITWFPLLGSGPQWAWLVSREAADCSERWWYHALYVQNHLATGKFCMGHTWYLAVDMQLHVLGVFVMVFLMRYPHLRVPVLMGLVLGSGAAAGFVVYWYQLTPMVTAQSPEALRTFFTGSKVLTLLYLPFWMNLPGYVGGVATAFILYHNQQSGVKINQRKWFNITFQASIPLGCCVVLAGAVFLSDSPQPMWMSVVYAGLDRIMIAVCFNLFLLGCFSRCNSVLRDILERRCFHTLGRLSYCVFLTHFIVLRLTFAEDTQLGHASILSMISLLITTSVISYAVSVPLYLLVELPALQLWKALTQSVSLDSRESRNPGTSPVPPQPVLRPFDLVAHLRKRHEFC